MPDADNALSQITKGLRNPLLEEYRKIVTNFFEHRWDAAELGGGRFCEVVFSILDGHAKGSYPSQPSKPRDMVSACRALESNTNVPRSFQILIPRMLPALYEIRNNRGVGHVSGDVDPNAMDASAVYSIASWIMAELVRVYHALDVHSAQGIVDALAERPIPLVWQGDGTKIVMDPTWSMRDQILILLSSSADPVKVDELQKWLKYNNRAYVIRIISNLDKERLVHFIRPESTVRLLPSGAVAVSALVARRVVR
jgi:hypothetical protein